MRKKYSVKHSLLLLLFVTLSFISYAQVSNRDVIYLKNGSIIKGIVIEMVPGGIIKIKTADGSVFIYQMDEVLRTEKEEDTSKKPEQNTVEESFNSKGFLMARVGPCISPESDNVFVIIPSFIAGVKLNNYISIGVGVEMMKYSFSNDQITDINMYPVFLDTRLYIPRKRVQPMFSVQIGYAFGSKGHGTYYQGSYIDFVPKSHSGGAFASLGAGMRIFLNKTLSFVFDGGFTFQSMKGYSSNYQSSSQAQLVSLETTTMPSLRVNVGFAVNLGNNKKIK